MLAQCTGHLIAAKEKAERMMTNGSYNMDEVADLLAVIERAHECFGKPLKNTLATKAEKQSKCGPVVQEWVGGLTIMQQTVLLAAIRGPDGLHKNHVAKVLLRWYRRCVLVSAFDGRVLEDPYEDGGGSFTGPCSYVSQRNSEDSPIDNAVADYTRCLDEVPHHFQLHFMHAAEILGYKHPVQWKRNWWNKVYRWLVADMHLQPESMSEMDARLSDDIDEWKSREIVTAD